MKAEKLMEAFGELDEVLIRDALAYRKPRRSFAAVAAAAAVFVGIAVVAVPLTRWMDTPGASGVDPLIPGVDTPITMAVEPPKIYGGANGIARPIVVDERAAVINYDESSYLIDNKTTEEITVNVRCPFYASYENVMDLPEVLAETGPLSFSLEVGKELTVPSDEGYNVEIWDGAPDFMNKVHADGDAEVCVYKVSGYDLSREIGGVKVEFTLPEGVSVYSFGFQSWNYDEAADVYTLEMRGRADKTAYLLTVGGELLPPDSKRPINLPKASITEGYGGHYLDRLTMTLAEAVEMIVELDNASMAEARGDALHMYDVEHELYTQSVIDWLYDYTALSAEPLPRYEIRHLETILADVRWAPRVFFLTFDLTLPAAGSVKIWEAEAS